MFGTCVSIVNQPKNVNELILENVDFNPMHNHSPKVKLGYLFRSPNVAKENWYDVLSGLANIEGSYQLWAEARDKTINCFVRITDKNDAAMFALGNSVHWQKWSKEQQVQAVKDAKAKKQKKKIKVNKDGTITVKISVDTLDNP